MNTNNTVYQAIKINKLTIASLAAATVREALKGFTSHFAGNLTVSESDGKTVIDGELKNFDFDMSEFQPGIGGHIYDLISEYDVKYQIEKATGIKLASKEFARAVRVDSEDKVGDKIESVYGW